MTLRVFLGKLRDACKGMFNGYKWGGVTHVTITPINYGTRFSADDTILVSGGSKGIGLCIAKKLLSEGATVIITGRNLTALNLVSSQLNNKNLHVFEMDISAHDSIEKMLREMEEKVGKGITALINNAGVYDGTSFPNCTEKDITKVFMTNASGTLLMSQAIIKRWLQDDSQRMRKIINISSQGGFVGANNAYRMTKWGIRGLTEYLGHTYAPHGIVVNGVAPGIVMTDMQPQFQKQGDNYYTQLNPQHRIALPEEIAEIVAFLLTDAANTIVGQTICCDCGYSLK